MSGRSCQVPASGGPLVFVDDLDSPVLSDDDHHHLARVRRVRSGEEIFISDGSGSWRRARFAGQVPEPSGDVVATDVPSPRIGVGFALVKGHKPELVVQKLTELGVDRIVPFVAARSVVRWDDRKEQTAAARLSKVAREAAMQSRRSHIPEVEQITTFAALAAEPTACLAHMGGGPVSLERPLVLIGPEGGWDASELDAALPAVSLVDGGVLRAETAAIAAAALLTALRAAAPG